MGDSRVDGSIAHYAPRAVEKLRYVHIRLKVGASNGYYSIRWLYCL